MKPRVLQQHFGITLNLKNMSKEIIYQLLPYSEQCLKVRGHEKLRRNGLVPHSMKWIDNKCKNFTQHQCPNCKMYVVWIKK